ncbi:MAG: glycosyltransferase family 39 protein [Bacteroidota bacterium]
MKKYWPILVLLSLLKLSIQFLGNRHYGFHRDELLHLSVSEHLDWGFMEFPPLIGVLGKLSFWWFDYHLLGVRLFPTLAGLAILLLCMATAKELGGKGKAVLLAGICVLGFLPFYRNHTLFQPVAFDQLFWILGFYWIIRYINTPKPSYLFFFGGTLALGILNKYTMLLWAMGVLVGLLFYQRGRLYKNKWWYAAGGLSLLLILPNILWQIQNNYPIFRHLEALKTAQLDQINAFDFVLDQLQFPMTLSVSLIGLGALLINQKLSAYRALGIACLVIFFSMWGLQSKSYYLFALYPVLFASGAVQIESWLSTKPILVYLIAAGIFLPIVPFIPRLTPVLPIEQYVRYADKAVVDGRVELTGDYADMFGWEEQVQLVDSVYQSLSKTEQQNCVLWAENYGEAGAIKILGKKYGLPTPISRHGSFWLWGYGDPTAQVWISLGNEQEAVEHVFEEVHLVKTIRHRYAIDEENNIPLYLCRQPKVDIPTWWKAYEAHIFD